MAGVGLGDRGHALVSIRVLASHHVSEPSEGLASPACSNQILGKTLWPPYLIASISWK
jgi:hypothetical protein